MPAPASSTDRVQFGLFELDLQRAELRKQGVKVKLQEQPLKVLQVLLENPGQIVPREELRQRVWPANTFVEFDQGLYSAMSRLRDALGDSSESPRFIETVARRGYRFLAPVRGPNPEIAPRPIEPEPKLPPQGLALRRWASSLMAGLLGGALLLGIVLGFNIAGAREWLKSRTTQIRSVAVLPMQNLSNDPQQDYFADGITDELTTELAQLSNLRVTSRTSAMYYKNTKKTLPQIARELNVDAILEGSVTRSGNRVRITAQLIQADGDRHIWARRYDRDMRDILDVQSSIAQGITEEVQTKLRPVHAPRSIDLEAHDLYLRGRYAWNQRTEASLNQAISFFQQAIDRDPGYAEAYAGLADSYAVLPYFSNGPLPEDLAKARLNAEHAVQLDPTISAPHATLGLVHTAYHRLSAAEGEYQRALELNPSYATAHHWYAFCLWLMDRRNEALAEFERARHLDPVSLVILTDEGGVLAAAHQMDEAIKTLKNVIDLDPNYPDAHRTLAAVYVQAGDIPHAISEGRRGVDLSPHDDYALATMGYVYGVAGEKEQARAMLAHLTDPRRPVAVAPFYLSLIYVGLGQKDEALKSIERAHNEGSLLDGSGPELMLDPIRSDPRFQSSLRQKLQQVGSNQ